MRCVRDSCPGYARAAFVGPGNADAAVRVRGGFIPRVGSAMSVLVLLLCVAFVALRFYVWRRGREVSWWYLLIVLVVAVFVPVLFNGK